MSTPLIRPSTAPRAIDSSTATGSDAPESTIALATMTAQTITMLATETSMPPVMMMTVIPMPIVATGAMATSRGTTEPLVKNAGVANASTTQSTAITPIRTISWPVIGNGRTRPRAAAVAGGAPGGAPPGEARVCELMPSPPSPPRPPPRRGRRPGWRRDRTRPWWCRPHDLQPVGDADRLRQVRGDDENGGPLVREPPDDLVDLFLRAHVHALGRLGAHQDGGALDQLAGQHDLLGIAAGHRRDRLSFVGRLDSQPGDELAGHLALAAAVHPGAEAGQHRQVPGGDVEGDRLEAEQALLLAVGRQQR